MKIIILKGLCNNFFAPQHILVAATRSAYICGSAKNMEMPQPINLILLHVCFYRFSIPTLLAHPHKEIIFLYFFHGWIATSFKYILKTGSIFKQS